jgi:hypothetical protein
MASEEGHVVAIMCLLSLIKNVLKIHNAQFSDNKVSLQEFRQSSGGSLLVPLAVRSVLTSAAALVRLAACGCRHA